MQSPRTVFLLRHGEVEGAHERRLIGRSDVPLSSAGIRQAELRAEQWMNAPFEHIVCSTLKRSRQTAEIIAEKSRCPVTVEPDLCEIGLGRWEGLASQEIRERYEKDWEERGKNMEHARPPGGESFADLASRVIPVFQAVIDRTELGVLIVGHGGVNRVILCRALGVPLSNVLRIRQDYAALNLIEIVGQNRAIKLMNAGLIDTVGHCFNSD